MCAKFLGIGIVFFVPLIIKCNPWELVQMLSTSQPAGLFPNSFCSNYEMTTTNVPRTVLPIVTGVLDREKKVGSRVKLFRQGNFPWSFSSPPSSSSPFQRDPNDSCVPPSQTEIRPRQLSCLKEAAVGSPWELQPTKQTKTNLKRAISAGWLVDWLNKMAGNSTGWDEWNDRKRAV